MKTKFKLSVLAGALALAVTAQANASINAGTGIANPDLILSIWDTTSTTSYTEDLGISIDGFVSGPVVNGGNSFVTGDAGNGGASHTWTADATLSSFLSGIAANAATTYWNVTAVGNGLTGANGIRVLSTSTVGTVAAPINSLLSTANFGNANGYYAAAALAAGTANDVTAALPAPAYAGGTTFADKFGGKLAFSNMANLGVSQNFFFLTPGTGNSIAKAQVGQFADIAGVSKWKLDSTGTLGYTVAAVPEPGEWALMLSGFGLIGFIASRRKNQNTSMTFA